MSIPNCSNGAEATATRGCVLPRASLVLTITTAQKIFAISSSRDKISCHNFARLSSWCWRALHASGIFQIFHLSFRATARESSQQAYFAPLDCHVTTFVAPRNDKMAGRPHPIVMLSEVETSPGKEMMQISQDYLLGGCAFGAIRETPLLCLVHVYTTTNCISTKILHLRLKSQRFRCNIVYRIRIA